MACPNCSRGAENSDDDLCVTCLVNKLKADQERRGFTVPSRTNLPSGTEVVPPLDRLTQIENLLIEGVDFLRQIERRLEDIYKSGKSI